MVRGVRRTVYCVLREEEDGDGEARGVKRDRRIGRSAQEGLAVHGVLRTTRTLERQPARRGACRPGLAVGRRDGTPDVDRLGLGIERSAREHIAIDRQLDPAVLGPRRHRADHNTGLEAEDDSGSGRRGDGR